ncbi:uncharacterized protein J3D65DRAFT_45651 [Phyllosticta citribraziliensis]|uniref:Uncharacterized protein n=1 Tax=Phyllosticta citribraziliensis TaxID=989973 RepID=A0ABR1MAU5_9PEZI
MRGRPLFFSASSPSQPSLLRLVVALFASRGRFQPFTPASSSSVLHRSYFLPSFFSRQSVAPRHTQPSEATEQHCLTMGGWSWGWVGGGGQHKAGRLLAYRQARTENSILAWHFLAPTSFSFFTCFTFHDGCVSCTRRPLSFVICFVRERGKMGVVPWWWWWWWWWWSFSTCFLVCGAGYASSSSYIHSIAA